MTLRRPDEHDEVVRRACAGDDDALAELVLLYHDLVYRYGPGRLSRRRSR